MDFLQHLSIARPSYIRQMMYYIRNPPPLHGTYAFVCASFGASLMSFFDLCPLASQGGEVYESEGEETMIEWDVETPTTSATTSTS